MIPDILKNTADYLSRKNISLPQHSQDTRQDSASKEFENKDNKRDYYYIVVSKINTNDVFIVSLKHISDVSPAPNNLTFQCRWDKCRKPVDRTWEQAKHFLLSHWAESIERKINLAKGGMPIYYPEFFNEK